MSIAAGPMSTAKPALIYPSPRNVSWRKLLVKIWRSPYAPARVEIVENGIQRGDALLEQGWGLVLPFTHFSGRDIFEMTLRPFAASERIVRKPGGVGVEWSHLTGFSALRVFAGLAGIAVIMWAPRPA